MSRARTFRARARGCEIASPPPEWNFPITSGPSAIANYSIIRQILADPRVSRNVSLRPADTPRAANVKPISKEHINDYLIE
jgi:hypothetical protein